MTKALFGPLAALLACACGQATGEPARDVAGPDGPPAARVRAGTSKADITPDFEPFTDTNGNHRWDEGEPFEDLDQDGALDSLWVGGFGVRQPTGVHDPLTVRTVALEVDGQLFTFTAIDSLGMSMRRIDAIRQAVASALPGRLDPTHVFVASIHTHQAPDTLGIFAPDFQSGVDPAYCERVVERSVKTILEAVAGLAPAHLRVAGADGSALVRDIVPPELVEPYVGVVQLLSAGDGSAIATMAAIANHAEAAWADNTLLSPDFPHYLRERIEARAGGMAVFFAADLGLMMVPVDHGGFEDSMRIGEAYADLILSALDAAPTLPDEGLVPSFGHRSVQTPLQNLSLILAVEAGLTDGYEDYLYRVDDSDSLCAPPGGCFDLPASALRLGEEVTFICAPAELTPELVMGGAARPSTYESLYPDAPPEPAIADHVRTRHRMVLGLCGAAVGYLYPKVHHNPAEVFDQQHGPGADAASAFMRGLADLLDSL